MHVRNSTGLPRLACFIGWICAGLIAGCQVPDVGPFVTATGDLKAAVASSGAATEQELRLAPGAAASADQLKAAWSVRNKAMSAMLRYAQSLDAIVAAGKSGAQSAGQIADSVKALADAAGVVFPGSPAAAAVVTDAVKFIGEQVANVRAAKEIAKALQAAQPAIEKFVELAQLDTKDLDDILQAANVLVETAIVSQMSASGLQDQRKSILDAVKKPRDLSKKDAREELAELSKLLADIETHYAAYQSKLAANQARLRASRQLVAATAAALDAWSTAHAQLATAAENNRTVDPKALIAAAVELRDLVKRIREL